MAENYTTYTEVDPNSRVAVTSATRIDFTNLTREEDAYVVYDFGSALFVGDFVIDVDYKPTSGSASSTIVCPVLLGDILDNPSGYTGSCVYMRLYINSGGFQTQAVQVNEGTVNGSTNSGVDALNTQRYGRFVRDTSVGTYGTLYFRIYSDAARTALVEEQVRTLDSLKSYRYLYALSSYNDGITARTGTGIFENLNIVSREAGASFTVAGTSTVSMAPTVKKEASFTVTGTSTVSMAPTGGVIHVQASMTVTGVSTVTMAPTGGYIPVTASMTVTGASSVAMAPTAKLTASMTMAAVSTVTMAPTALLPLHPYTVIGFPAGYAATVQYKVLDIAKTVVQDWTNTDVVETATGVTGYSVYDVIIRLERGFQGLILWKIPGTTYHAEEPIDLTPLVYPTLLEMKLGGIALEATASTRLAASAYTAPDNAGIAQIQTDIATAQTDITSLLTYAVGMSKWKNNKLARTGISGTVETWVLYDDDNTTPLLTWTHDTSTKVRNKAT